MRIFTIIDLKMESMKRIFYLLVLLPILIWGQDNNQNFVKSIQYREVGGANPKVTVDYYDGLGRLAQKVENKQSGNGNDIVTHFAYVQGRQLKEYLPYSTNQQNMAFSPNAEQSTLNYPYYVGKFPFSETIFESSPLERIVKQGAPGLDWQVNPIANTDHSIKFEYRTNEVNEVKKYLANTSWNANSGLYDAQLQEQGFYNLGDLEKVITKDENWTGGTNNTIEDFINREGQLILKRTYNNGPHDTYYVYDKFGNISYVIPPLVTNISTQLDDLCYQYKYDKRKRLVEKKLPGKQWEFMVYDKGDRLIASGPVNSPFSNLTNLGWLVNKYDALGRIIYTGWYLGTEVNSSGRKSIQATLNFSNNFFEVRGNPIVLNGVSIGYTNLVFPTVGMHVLSINYYDNYTFPSALAVPSTIEGQNIIPNPKTLATAAWSRILTTTEETLGELSTVYYDSRGREISLHKTTPYGGYTKIDVKLDFDGDCLLSKTYHKKESGSTLLTISDQFTYTPEDRPLLHLQQINNQPIQLISKNSYNEIGELISKNLGGNDVTGATGLQKVDYRYNIRGWVTDVNNDAAESTASFTLGQGDLFGFKINYNKVSESQNGIILSSTQSAGGLVKPLFNGNIAETFWMSSSDNQLRKYGYQYDALNRVQGAFYQKPLSVNPQSGSYDELATYDKNGNILSLKRKGNLDNPIFNFEIDNLSYSYNGNKLVKITDSSNNPEGFYDRNNPGNTYQYDQEGSLISDSSKGIIEIKYNHLNQPREIRFSNGGKINYIYSADGTKLSKTVFSDGSLSKIDYIHGFQYDKGLLSFFPHDEGYVKVTNGSYFNYVFNFLDQVGNVRASWSFDDRLGTTRLIEESHYYPFGLKHKAYNAVEYSFIEPAEGEGYYLPILAQTSTRDPKSPYNYKFNGQEWQDELGLNVTAMDFRQYDGAIGRFSSPDLLAESFPDVSPYVFSFANPILFGDPSGLCPECPDPKDAKEGDVYVSTGGGSYSFSNGNWTRNDGDLEEIVINTEKEYVPKTSYGGDGSGSALDVSMKVADVINQFNPIASVWDVVSYTFTGRDRLGNKMSTLEASVTAITVVPALKGIKGAGALKGAARANSGKLWQVGAYNEIKGTKAGLDAHHVGQKAIMKRFIPGYNQNTAPAILVPKVGHTIAGKRGIVSRSISGFTNSRQVLARDIFELRRVYGPEGIPNKVLMELINKNKAMYPSAFAK